MTIAVISSRARTAKNEMVVETLGYFSLKVLRTSSEASQMTFNTPRVWKFLARFLPQNPAPTKAKLDGLSKPLSLLKGSHSVIRSNHLIFFAVFNQD